MFAIQSILITMLKAEHIAHLPWDWRTAIDWEALADSIHEIFEAHRNDAMPDISNIQHFDRQPPYICFDLQDFLSRIATPDENTGLEQALSQAILYHAATPSVMGDVSIYKHCGLSCYILGTGNTTLDRYYTTLDWYKRVYPDNN